jgi:general secretion pathway protein G
MVSLRRPRGFTMVELMVVMAIVGLLLALAWPRFAASLERGREQVLRHDLATMREAIDRFHGDVGRWPESLQELVQRRYLRALPPDPITDSVATWQPLPPPDGTRGVHDVRSGAPGNASTGEPYAQW